MTDRPAPTAAASSSTFGVGAGGGGGGASGALKLFYVAVSSAEAKLPTLVELLEALRAGCRLAVAVACSSRDAVDAVAAALAACAGAFNIAILHSDMQLHDIEQQVLQLKRRLQQHTGGASSDTAAAQAGQQQQQHPGMPADQAPAVQQQQQQQQQQAVAAAAGGQDAVEDDRSLVLVTSDVCLKALQRDLLPLGLPLLIQYDTAPSKEVLQRRLGAVFGSSKERGRAPGRLVAIDFVAAGELAAFRARERLSTLPVLEMPVHVPDVFA